jgi:SpoVK/Ycf46/Vps4 family AAA+-type ATPase
VLLFSYDISKLAKESKGFSGAELEEVVKEALFQAYDSGHQLEGKDMLGAIGKTFPLARTMHEQIDDMRQWARSRAVPASEEEPEALDEWKNDNTPKLQQEGYANPFIRNDKKKEK